jgi:hypothetical protein
MAAFNIVDESPVGHTVAPGSGVVAGEIPVTQVVWAGCVQISDGLVDHIEFRGDFAGMEHLGDLPGDVLVREGGVYLLYMILSQVGRELLLFLAF